MQRSELPKGGGKPGLVQGPAARQTGHTSINISWWLYRKLIQPHSPQRPDHRWPARRGNLRESLGPGGPTEGSPFPQEL